MLFVSTKKRGPPEEIKRQLVALFADQGERLRGAEPLLDNSRQEPQTHPTRRAAKWAYKTVDK
jgi:hypothetical protein